MGELGTVVDEIIADEVGEDPVPAEEEPVPVKVDPGVGELPSSVLDRPDIIAEAVDDQQASIGENVLGYNNTVYTYSGKFGGKHEVRVRYSDEVGVTQCKILLFDDVPSTKEISSSIKGINVRNNIHSVEEKVAQYRQPTTNIGSVIVSMFTPYELRKYIDSCEVTETTTWEDIIPGS
jgi:hypothetical protein